jgi:hypothetical protein
LLTDTTLFNVDADRVDRRHAVIDPADWRTTP